MQIRWAKIIVECRACNRAIKKGQRLCYPFGYLFTYWFFSVFVGFLLWSKRPKDENSHARDGCKVSYYCTRNDEQSFANMFLVIPE
jgi:hypothetical protein